MARAKLPPEVFKKAAELRKEGKTKDQALGAAAGMARAGRLTKQGDYIRGNRKRG